LDTKIVVGWFLKSALIGILFFTSSIFAYTSKTIILCIGETTLQTKSLSQDFNHSDFHIIQKVVPSPVDEAKYIEAVSTIQQAIRSAIELYRHPYRELPHIILYAKGLSATLTAIAQNNLLPYYREHISGLILDNAEANLLKVCDFYDKRPQNRLCDSLRYFTQNLQGRASLVESAIALSPSLQMDWFWPKTLLLFKDENLSKRELPYWKEAFEENGIEYSYGIYKESNRTNNKKEQIISNFIAQLLTSVTKKLLDPKPSYYGAVLRFHLYKIAYKPKDKLLEKYNISYGDDPLQSYDLFVKEQTKNNPLFIYIHGGGWSRGDKISFDDIAKQYADRGFSAVSINYRLHKLPEVGMKEIVDDVRSAIRHIVAHAKAYHANSNKIVIVAESAGAQLAFMAVARLKKEEQKKIKALILNSMTSDLSLHPKAKQIRLSGIRDDNARLKWIETYSPLNNLKYLSIPILAIQSINDQVVPPKHLKRLTVESVIYHDNITPLWISNGVHPISPFKHTLQPGYQYIQEQIHLFERRELNLRK